MVATMSLDAFNIALAKAGAGLTWSYPCLIWIADYLRDATGEDFAKGWRGIEWDEARARRELATLARAGEGRTAIEAAMDGFAKAHGWPEAEGPQQGAVMIGCYTSPDGDVGVPAIFDGRRRWLISGTGAATITLAAPARIWEIPKCAG